jgi:hypothetical protein
VQGQGDAGLPTVLYVTFGMVLASLKVPLQFGIAVATVVSRAAVIRRWPPEFEPKGLRFFETFSIKSRL